MHDQLLHFFIFIHCPHPISCCDNSFASNFKMGNRNFQQPGFLLIRGYLVKT
jgi:hypothetical protein